MHHVVLCLPFLVLSLLPAFGLLKTDIQPKFRHVSTVSLIVFILANIYFFVGFSQPHVREHDDWSKMDLHRILQNPQLATSYFYVVVD
ncbi:MAG: hypothetical protein QGG39_14395 [Candidatus Poribacteria bacterium]|nr:hypothetical protein [Candidatus Poribacteria bacterium]